MNSILNVTGILFRLLRALLKGTIALSSAWIVFSHFFMTRELTLPPALDARRETFQSLRAGRINIYADRSGSGRPLVLVHSINAAASAYEMRPLFEQYQGQRPVFALELPGFGFSERGNRVYTPQLFADAIADTVAGHFDEPVDIVGLSLSSDFIALAMQQRPELFRSVVMVSPLGFARRDAMEESQRRSADQGHSVHRALSFPLWAQPLFDLLTTRVSIRWFLSQSFAGTVDEDLVAYSYLSSHQPGARFAPFYFVSGLLFTPDNRQQLYEPLTQPVLVIYDEDAYTRFDHLPAHLAAHDNWQAERIVPTRGLAHYERPEKTAEAMERFWSGLE